VFWEHRDVVSITITNNNMAVSPGFVLLFDRLVLIVIVVMSTDWPVG
jgi:hypothetical protein